MITQKVTECLQKVMSDNRIAKAIETRDKHKDYKLKSICTKIIRKDSNSKYFRMIVRIGFDYLQRVSDENIREDILVDVSYLRNKKSGAETFDILNVNFVPELPNP